MRWSSFKRRHSSSPPTTGMTTSLTTTSGSNVWRQLKSFGAVRGGGNFVAFEFEKLDQEYSSIFRSSSTIKTRPRSEVRGVI